MRLTTYQSLQTFFDFRVDRNFGSDVLLRLARARPCAPLLPWSQVCKNCSLGSSVSTVSLGSVALDSETGNVSPFVVEDNAVEYTPTE